MRNTILITLVCIVVFVLLRLAGFLSPGWFLGLGAICAVFGVFIVLIMAGGMEGEWQLQFGGFLLTLGIVLLIVNWLLGAG